MPIENARKPSHFSAITMRAAVRASYWLGAVVSAVFNSAIRRGAVVMVAATLSACVTPHEGAAPLGLSEVLARHADARGGQQALEALQSIELELAITEPTFQVTGHYRATREGMVRIDIFSSGTRVFTEAIGKDGAWSMNAAGEVSDVSQAGREALQRGLVGNLYALHERPGVGYVLEFGGLQQHDGSMRFVIEERTETGFVKSYFLDPESYLIVSSIESSALHPDLNPDESVQETYWSDHRRFSGILFPERSRKVDLGSGEEIQSVGITRREVNANIDPEVFSRPADSDGIAK